MGGVALSYIDRSFDRLFALALSFAAGPFDRTSPLYSASEFCSGVFSFELVLVIGSPGGAAYTGCFGWKNDRIEGCCARGGGGAFLVRPVVVMVDGCGMSVATILYAVCWKTVAQEKEIRNILIIKSHISLLLKPVFLEMW